MRRSVSLAIILASLLALVVPILAFAQQPKRGGVLRIAEREAPSLTILPDLAEKWTVSKDGKVEYGLGMRLVFTWFDK